MLGRSGLSVTSLIDSPRSKDGGTIGGKAGRQEEGSKDHDNSESSWSSQWLVVPYVRAMYE